MSHSQRKKIGIVIRGSISAWTKDIVREYQKRFSFAEIIVSTWDNQDTKGISCKIIKSKSPETTSPHKSNINHQVLQAQAGLRGTSADIIMMCRSDQFIHNSKIFEVYDRFCPKTKILVTSVFSFIKGVPMNSSYEYFVSDLCQITTNKIMHDFWDHIPHYDGSKAVSMESYIVENYVRNIKNDKRKWIRIKDEYFYERDYYEDFRIEFEKQIKIEKYKKLLSFYLRKFSH